MKKVRKTNAPRKARVTTTIWSELPYIKYINTAAALRFNGQVMSALIDLSVDDATDIFYACVAHHRELSKRWAATTLK